jgi:hypothetical protein
MRRVCVSVSGQTLSCCMQVRRRLRVPMPVRMRLRHTPGFAKRLGAVPVLAGADGAARRVVHGERGGGGGGAGRRSSCSGPESIRVEWARGGVLMALHNLTAGFQFGCRRELGAQIVVHKVQTRLGGAGAHPRRRRATSSKNYSEVPVRFGAGPWFAGFFCCVLSNVVNEKHYCAL